MPTLDVRWPIGVLWVIIGVLLLGYGLAGRTPDAATLAVDRWWGAIMMAFGLVMLALAARHRTGQSPQRTSTNDVTNL